MAGVAAGYIRQDAIATYCLWIGETVAGICDGIKQRKEMQMQAFYATQVTVTREANTLMITAESNTRMTAIKISRGTAHKLIADLQSRLDTETNGETKTQTLPGSHR